MVYHDGTKPCAAREVRCQRLSDRGFMLTCFEC